MTEADFVQGALTLVATLAVPIAAIVVMVYAGFRVVDLIVDEIRHILGMGK